MRRMDVPSRLAAGVAIVALALLGCAREEPGPTAPPTPPATTAPAPAPATTAATAPNAEMATVTLNVQGMT